MKIYLTLFLILLLSGCELFNTEQGEEGACNEQLFEEIRLKKSLPVSIRYNIEYSDEKNLSEEEIQEQRKRIRQTHEKFLKSLQNFQISSIRKSNYIPWIALFANSEETLSFICSNKLVLEVSKSEIGTSHKHKKQENGYSK